MILQKYDEYDVFDDTLDELDCELELDEEEVERDDND